MAPDDLDRIQEEKPEPASSVEAEHEAKLHEYKRQDAESRTKLNKWVARFIPIAVNSWLIILLVLLIADSTTFTWHEDWRIQSFDIDTYVMVALVGSTSLAVGGLVNYALKSLLGKTQE